MLQGTVLPGPAPRAADVAAPVAGSNSAVAALGVDSSECTTPSFGAVLREKLAAETALPEAPGTAAVDPTQLTQPAMTVDPALQALFATLQSAAVVPQAMQQTPAADTSMTLPATNGIEGSDSSDRIALAAPAARTDTMMQAHDLAKKDAASSRVADSQQEGDREAIRFSDLARFDSADKLQLRASAETKPQDLTVLADGARARPQSEVPPHVVTLHTNSTMNGEQRAEAATVRANVAPEVFSPKWSGSFAERVTWITQSAQPSAELQLNPPQLGPIEVRVSVDADQQTSLSFFSPHAAVRDAIQAAIPRLTDAFNASGLSLGNVFVGAESQSQAQNQQDQRGGGYARRDNFVPEADVDQRASQVTWLRNGSLGSIDLFA